MPDLGNINRNAENEDADKEASKATEPEESRLNVMIPTTLHNDLRVYAARNKNRTIKKTIRKAAVAYLKEKGELIEHSPMQ